MRHRQIKTSVFSVICGCLLLFPLRINSFSTGNEALSVLAPIPRQPRRPPNGVPIIRLEKSRFALGESVFFWVGVESTSRDPIPKEYQNTCRLHITRPDGTSKTEPGGWPADGVVDRGWL